MFVKKCGGEGVLEKLVRLLWVLVHLPKFDAFLVDHAIKNRIGFGINIQADITFSVVFGHIVQKPSAHGRAVLDHGMNEFLPARCQRNEFFSRRFGVFFNRYEFQGTFGDGADCFRDGAAADVIPPRHCVLYIFAAHRQAFNAFRANGPQHGDLVPVQNIIGAKRVFHLHADNVVNSKEKVQELFSGQVPWAMFNHHLRRSFGVF